MDGGLGGGHGFGRRGPPVRRTRRASRGRGRGHGVRAAFARLAAFASIQGFRVAACLPSGLCTRRSAPGVSRGDCEDRLMATAEALNLTLLYERDETAWLEVMSALAAAGRHAE